jgi:hypothetical protein
MRKRDKKAPIMSEDQERFMAFEGLVQWTLAAIEQGKRVEAATSARVDANRKAGRLLGAQRRTEHHYFSIAANKVLEHCEWVRRRGLCSEMDFSMLDQFSRRDIRDLRNMREHVVDYFEGYGRDRDRWEIETPEFKADASASVGTLIGGRLDWKLFVAAAERLLPILLSEPIPQPSPDSGVL